MHCTPTSMSVGIPYVAHASGACRNPTPLLGSKRRRTTWNTNTRRNLIDCSGETKVISAEGQTNLEVKWKKATRQGSPQGLIIGGNQSNGPQKNRESERRGRQADFVLSTYAG